MASPKSGAVLGCARLSRALLAGLVDNRSVASNNPLELAGALASTIRVAHLLGVEQLLPVAEQYPPSIQGMMSDPPEPAVDPAIDAFVESSDYIGFLELLDLLSDEETECIAPHLHRGWQDKRQSCHSARALSRRVIGYSIGQQYRESLLKGLAIHNRFSVVPAPLQLRVGQIRGALASTLELIERLTPKDKAADINGLVSDLREQLR